MKKTNYEQKTIPQLRYLAHRRKVPVPSSLSVMRGITNDPYAERGRADLISSLGAMDTDKSNSTLLILTIVTIILAAASAFASILALFTK